MNTLLLALLLTLAPAPPDGDAAAVWPLDPRPEVVRPFDPPAAAWLAGHRGVDLLGAPGRPVRAALAGTVVFAGALAGRGVVVIAHGAERTTYEPVEAAVGLGDPVPAGAVIGHLQAGGASHCLPRTCLHWGRIRNSDDVYLDPLALLGLGPVRLLPLEGSVASRAGPGMPSALRALPA